MMFKVGDAVKCIKGQPDYGLYEGVIYTVNSTYTALSYVPFIKVLGNDISFYESRFKLMTEPVLDRITSLLSEVEGVLTIRYDGLWRVRVKMAHVIGTKIAITGTNTGEIEEKLEEYINRKKPIEINLNDGNKVFIHKGEITLHNKPVDVDALRSIVATYDELNK